MLDIIEIFDKIIIRSGQFILRKNKVELDIDNFRTLVEDALEIYNDFSPYDRTYQSVDLQSSRTVTFDAHFDKELGRKPDYISLAHPIRSFASVYSNSRSGFGGFGYGIQNDGNVEPIIAPWEYDFESGQFIGSYAAYWKITGVYRHLLEEVQNEETGEFIYCVKTMSLKDQGFFKLLQAMFLMGVGRSRRAFTLTELPILMDASEMISEGKEMREEAIEELGSRYQKFRLAYGG